MQPAVSNPLLHSQMSHIGNVAFYGTSSSPCLLQHCIALPHMLVYRFGGCVAEEVAGEYVWGVYDLLLLPPSFPYGGMPLDQQQFCYLQQLEIMQ